MLDQNTDRMWYVIGAVIVGAALIFLMNGTFPTLFANIGETFEEKVGVTTEMTDGIRPVMKVNENLLSSDTTHSGWLDDKGIVNGANSNGILYWGDWTSDYIAVEDAEYMAFSTNGRHHIKRAMFYSDIDQPMGERFLNSEPEDTVVTYAVPEGAQYIRVSSMNWGDGYFKLERGKYATGEPPVSGDPFFGQNLLLNTHSFTMDGVASKGVTRSVTPEGYLKVTVDESVSSGTVSDMGLNASAEHFAGVMQKGEMFTYSVQVQSPDVSATYGGQNLSMSFGKELPFLNLHGRIGPKWETFYITMTYNGTTLEPVLRLKPGTYLFRQPKIDKGVGATAYSAAPSDSGK